jgi:hypothetical protein
LKNKDGNHSERALRIYISDDAGRRLSQSALRVRTRQPRSEPYTFRFANVARNLRAAAFCGSRKIVVYKPRGSPIRRCTCGKFEGATFGRRELLKLAALRNA